MKKIVTYQLAFLISLAILSIAQDFGNLPSWYTDRLLFAQCTYIGGIGGTLYCLRAVYLNRSVLNQWDERWNVWYYLRPITSAISGIISCVFLKAGLLVLDASSGSGDTTYGFLALAFIAGYNVDNFLKRLEEIAKSAWGIAKSRADSIGDKPSKNEEMDG